MTDSKKQLASRLARIEGQVRGIARMIDEDRYCIDVITQIQAVSSALHRVENMVLKDHVAHCVEHAIASGDKGTQRQQIAELLQVLGHLPSSAAKSTERDAG
jgi:DNA-binding FrmR family transcriptional regulator